MTIGYKLVNQDYTTHGGMKWEIGKTNIAWVEGTQMCSPQVLHYYEHPLLAVLLNPRHADIRNPRMLKIECSEKVAGDGLKAACKEQTPIEEMEVPVLTTNQRVAFAIKCALAVYQQDTFVKWAEDWLSGKDRTKSSATAAACAAGAACAASAAGTAAAACATGAATGAAARAACAAVYAVNAATYAALPLVSIIEEVLQEGY